MRIEIVQLHKLIIKVIDFFATNTQLIILMCPVFIKFWIRDAQSLFLLYQLLLFKNSVLKDSVLKDSVFLWFVVGKLIIKRLIIIYFNLLFAAFKR